MFNGSFLGNLTGFLYFTVFILGGITIFQHLFKNLSFLTRIWLGSVAGTVLLMWLPIAFAFIFGFNILSHVLALIVLLAGAVFSVLWAKKHSSLDLAIDFNKEDLYSLIPVIIMTLFYAIVQTSHIMQPTKAGGMIFGQSTYADVHIHLSFITGPIAQGTVPFNYNIAPHVQASYPFLSDTVSASIYIWGASLRWSYIIPTIIGAFNIYLGAMLFFKMWLKKLSKAIVAWSLFTFNGGFGFIYFFDNLKYDTSNFTRIFENLYETPTNLDGNMIRWVNTFCDMMIPQRATLFGWMMLFAVIYLLYRAVFLKEDIMYIPAGILAGLTPLISTHIFLAVGLISATWMLSRLYVNMKYKPKYAGYVALSIALLGVILFYYIFSNDADILGVGAGASGLTMFDIAGYSVLLVCGGIIAFIYFALLVINLFEGRFKELLSTWGVFLIIVLVLALPQLIGFTFTQTDGDGFLTPHFNWINSKDNYFWFYIKNMGLPVLLMIPALLGASKRMKAVVAPMATIMLLAETLSLQPNVYDNNKLIYPAYVLLVGVVADYMVVIYEKMKDIKGRQVLAAGVMTACVLSGVLSMGREYVADDYEMFSPSHVKVAEWVDENTGYDDVFLTEDRFNNSITGLTGRSVVCGGAWFFSTHGLPDYEQLQSEVSRMYVSPLTSTDLFQKHSVDYIMVSDYERSKYPNVDVNSISTIADLVYDQDGIQLYKLK